MKIVIIRHGKVNYAWKKWSTSEEFDRDCIRYDKAPIIPLSNDISHIEYQNIYISTLKRSKETACCLFGEKDFISTKLINEVPLCASMVFKKRLPLMFWNISGRLQWLFNIHRQKEGKRDTLCRSEQFVKMLLEEGRDSVVVTHGFFMHTLIKVLKKNKFNISHTRLKYANGECIVAEC